MDALSVRSDVISSMKNLYQVRTLRVDCPAPTALGPASAQLLTRRLTQLRSLHLVDTCGLTDESMNHVNLTP